jgi:hypothetical protein
MRNWGLLVLACAALGLALAPGTAVAKKKRSHVTGQVYADNDFELYVNGRLVASDPVDFTPFNVVKLNFKATYPMTFAIRGKDFADPQTGLEYDNTRTGDGGLIAKFSNGLATDGSWSRFTTFTGPLNIPQCLASAAACQVSYTPEPTGWQNPGFDSSTWPKATVYSAGQVGPHDEYSDYNWSKASFIWGTDLVADNTLLFRRVVKHAPKN